jgi:ribonucleotide monophosphatase NagD (HAD superfamily)
MGLFNCFGMITQEFQDVKSLSTIRVIFSPSTTRITWFLDESDTLNFDVLTKAIRLVKNGSRFIATNPDISGPRERGIVPGCGVMAALIEKASGVNALYIGKPNPLMMRSAINYLGVHSEIR